MFANCTGLKTAPELPFQSNSSWNYGCYKGMFYKCTGLTTPPSSIPYVMHEYACYQMFYGCSKLTDASNITITGTYSYSHY